MENTVGTTKHTSLRRKEKESSAKETTREATTRRGQNENKAAEVALREDSLYDMRTLSNLFLGGLCVGDGLSMDGTESEERKEDKNEIDIERNKESKKESKKGGRKERRKERYKEINQERNIKMDPFSMCGANAHTAILGWSELVDTDGDIAFDGASEVRKFERISFDKKHRKRFRDQAKERGVTKSGKKHLIFRSNPSFNGISRSMSDTSNMSKTLTVKTFERKRSFSRQRPKYTDKGLRTIPATHVVTSLINAVSGMTDSSSEVSGSNKGKVTKKERKKDDKEGNRKSKRKNGIVSSAEAETEGEADAGRNYDADVDREYRGDTPFCQICSPPLKPFDCRPSFVKSRETSDPETPKSTQNSLVSSRADPNTNNGKNTVAELQPLNDGSNGHKIFFLSEEKESFLRPSQPLDFSPFCFQLEQCRSGRAIDYGEGAVKASPLPQSQFKSKERHNGASAVSSNEFRTDHGTSESKTRTLNKMKPEKPRKKTHSMAHKRQADAVDLTQSSPDIQLDEALFEDEGRYLEDRVEDDVISSVRKGEDNDLRRGEERERPDRPLHQRDKRNKKRIKGTPTMRRKYDAKKSSRSPIETRKKLDKPLESQQNQEQLVLFWTEATAAAE